MKTCKINIFNSILFKLKYSFRSQSQPPNRISPPRSNGSEAPVSLPNVPPKIDRQKKPSRRSGSSSNGGSGSNGEYLQTNGSSKGNSLERNSHIRDMKMVILHILHMLVLHRLILQAGSEYRTSE